MTPTLRFVGEGSTFRRHRIVWSLFAFVAASMLAMPSFAETETDPPGQIPIGVAQIAEFQGEETGDPDTTPLDLTIVSAVFGGPKQIAPPGTVTTDTGYAVDFSTVFPFEGASANNYFPTSVDPNVLATRLPTDLSVLEDCWIYAFVLINDDGFEEIPGLEPPGEAVLNFLGVSLDPTLVRLPAEGGLPGAFVNVAGTRGAYIYAYGQTDFKTFVNANSITGSQGNVTLRCEYGKAPIPESTGAGDPAARSQVIFYYSPFAPSIFNTTVSGTSNESISDNLETVFPGASYWPHFTCDVPTQPDPLEPDESATVPVNVSAEARTYYSRDYLRMPDGSAPEFFATLAYDEDPDPDCSGAISIDGLALCGEAVIPTTALSACVPFDDSVCIDVSVTAAGDICSGFAGCEFPIELVSSLTADSPYNAEPPFEGVTEFVPPVPPVPEGGDFLDADPEPEDVGELCPITVDVECPCIYTFDKKVEFCDFDLPESDCNDMNGGEMADVPRCGLVKVFLNISADAGNTEALIISSLVDDLPAGFEFVSGSVEGANGAEGGGVVTFSNVPDVTPGNTITVCYKARALPAAALGLRNDVTATVTAICEGDPGPGETMMDSVDVTVKAPNLKVIAGTPNPARVCPGETASNIPFTVQNNGDWPIVVNIPIATDGCLMIAQDFTGSVTLGPGASQPVNVTATYTPACDAGPETVTLAVSGHPEGVNPADTECDQPADDDVQVNILDPRISVSCTPETTIVEMDDVVGLTVTVRNDSTGGLSLNDLDISGCVADAGISIVGAIPAFAPATIAPGETAETVIMISVDTDEEGSYCVRNCVISASPVGETGDACDVTAPLSPCCVVIESPEKIPTLSEWGLILLVMALGGAMILRRRG